MEIITGYRGKPHVTPEQDRDVNIGVVGDGSYVLQTGMQLAAEVSSNNEVKIRDGVLMHQGCTASIKKNTYDSLTIINGSQGMKRIDLIVARYEKNQDNKKESLDLKVIQGTPAEQTPTAPEYTEGDIQAGDYVADMPMYQVIIDGLNITEVKKVFEVAPDIGAMKKEIAELNSKIDYTFSQTNPTANPIINGYQLRRFGDVVSFSVSDYKKGSGRIDNRKIGSIPTDIAPKNTIIIPFASTGAVTDTSSNPGSRIIIGSDGNVYIYSNYDSGNYASWSCTWII